jgi:crotonobetainyl-CoA:carnitine CoA-transferase CaiB-like acyl-CoA transferase
MSPSGHPAALYAREKAGRGQLVDIAMPTR